MKHFDPNQMWAAWQRFVTDQMRAWRLRERLSYHRGALLVVMLATLIGQAATLIQRPLLSVAPDTYSYIAVAQRISESPAGFINTFRTPGYPLFLALIFKLTGGVDYAQALTCHSMPTTPYCARTFQVIIIAQILIFILAVFECYVLAYRLSRRRWVAALIAALLGINIYVASWERAALSELLSMWAIITLFLCFERLVRAPSARWATLFGVGMFAVIMIRPSNFPLPLLLLPLLLVWWLRQGLLRANWRHAAVSGALVGGLLFGYMVANQQINGFFGITYVQNVDMLGKVMQYHLEDRPTEPKYEQLQRDLRAYLAAGNYDPFTFGRIYPAYGADNYRMTGAYASAMIKRYPLTFAQDTLPIIKKTWSNEVAFYAPYRLDYAPAPAKVTALLHALGARRYYQYPYGVLSIAYEPLWVNGLWALAEITLSLYWLLPALLVAMAAWVWRRKADAEVFIILCLLLTVASAILLSSVASYEEYTRLRFPMDWGMIAAGALILARAGIAARQHVPQFTRRWQIAPMAGALKALRSSDRRGPLK